MLDLGVMKKTCSILLAFLTALIGCGLAVYGVFIRRIEGPEAVTLFLGSIVIGIVIAVFPRILEFSIAGNVVKLRQEISEAHNALLTTFRLLLSQATKTEGGLDDIKSPKDSRIDFFWELYGNIEKAKMESELNEDIVDAVRIIASRQNRRIRSYYLGMQTSVDLTAEEMRGKANSEQVINDFVKRDNSNPDPEVIRRMFNAAIDEYERLYSLLNRII
jgi:hypothetical protein